MAGTEVHDRLHVAAKAVEREVPQCRGLRRARPDLELLISPHPEVEQQDAREHDDPCLRTPPARPFVQQQKQTKTAT